MIALGTERMNTSSSGLEKDILKALLYFDIFRFPLTTSEIFHFLPSNSITQADVSQALHSSSLQEMVKTSNGFIYLADAEGSYDVERLEKQRRAALMIKIARLMAKLIKMFPYVRGVFLSGELSKGVSGKNGDIDFVVVTQEGRLWISRTFLILFKKVFLFNRKRFFCLNHFVTEHHLQVNQKNVYTATEVATLLPMENDSMFARFMIANLWITRFFPNWKLDESMLRSERLGTSIVCTMVESIIPDRFAGRLDRWLMYKWQRIWNTRYAHLSDEERNRKYQCSEYLSTAYGEDYQESVLRSFRGRLKAYDVDEKVQTSSHA
jgi:hypothetical protein